MYSVGSYDTYGGVHVGLVCACMVLVVILSVLSVAACVMLLVMVEYVILMVVMLLVSGDPCRGHYYRCRIGDMSVLVWGSQWIFTSGKWEIIFHRAPGEGLRDEQLISRMPD